MSVSQPLVECHSDFRYADRPKAFIWEGERIAVSNIIAQWRSPNAVHFRVHTEKHGIFDLLYDEREGVWEIQQP